MSLLLESSQSAVLVIERVQFADLEAMRLAAESTLRGCLLLIEPQDVNVVLAWLSPKDDICLRNSPAELIEHRRQRLAAGFAVTRDPLTLLLSRHAFIRQLDIWASQANTNHPVSLMLCDLDHFKGLNDQFSHAVGDEVLATVARVLWQHCGAPVAIGRIGGEEFGVVCRRNGRDALILANELRQRMLDESFPEGVAVTLSFGVATTQDGKGEHQLMQSADHALYAAKANGRNCCCSFDDLQSTCRDAGNDLDVVGLENRARVLTERVTNFIAMRSRKLIRSVRREADVDVLTQCFNRRYLDRTLSEVFGRRGQQPLTLAFVDLDFFGQVNKQHGWQTGDKLLVEVCATIRSQLRADDWVGRYGGEEFCIVMPGATKPEAEGILRRIRETVEATQYVSTAGQTVPMTLSMGAAVATADDATHMELLERASKQTLQAKQGGRNQLCFAG